MIRSCSLRATGLAVAILLVGAAQAAVTSKAVAGVNYPELRSR